VNDAVGMLRTRAAKPQISALLKIILMAVSSLLGARDLNGLNWRIGGLSVFAAASPFNSAGSGLRRAADMDGCDSRLARTTSTWR
jgi:hypothetical protein